MNNTDITLFRQIGTISRKASTEMNRLATNYQLDNNLFLYLIRITENEGISQSALVKLMNIDKTTLSRAIKKLEKDKYIIKKPNPDNKKFNQLFVTEKTKNLYTKLSKLEQQYAYQALSNLTLSEKKTLDSLLTKINISI
ncbi:transcriptional regulator [Tetragenococcus halophilus subsp. flandriensis]|uniref:MarR family winged helix-turn-helix transcriptional regulator n=1 Tax=Tetragenococcus halophilus TaxID=51669 RepID=UPI0023E94868|nr:MarR family transcriptional regulator [Tetragenococcus halophilus]GMA07333.1 transcriptional regulator [Tetragenococcus halophilus subsp. flandriensis]